MAAPDTLLRLRRIRHSGTWSGSSELFGHVQKHAVFVAAVVEMVACQIRPCPVQVRGEAFPRQFFVADGGEDEIFRVAAADVEKILAAVKAAADAAVKRSKQAVAA